MLEHHSLFLSLHPYCLLQPVIVQVILDRISSSELRELPRCKCLLPAIAPGQSAIHQAFVFCAVDWSVSVLCCIDSFLLCQSPNRLHLQWVTLSSSFKTGIICLIHIASGYMQMALLLIRVRHLLLSTWSSVKLIISCIWDMLRNLRMYDAVSFSLLFSLSLPYFCIVFF